jgi:hypothetical protein
MPQTTISENHPNQFNQKLSVPSEVPLSPTIYHLSSAISHLPFDPNNRIPRTILILFPQFIGWIHDPFTIDNEFVEVFARGEMYLKHPTISLPFHR